MSDTSPHWREREACVGIGFESRLAVIVGVVNILEQSDEIRRSPFLRRLPFDED